MALFEPIFAALNQAKVRYVVVDGLATVLHGFARLTADVDLVVDLSPNEARKAIETLSALGFVPRAPVDPMGLPTRRCGQGGSRKRAWRCSRWSIARTRCDRSTCL